MIGKTMEKALNEQINAEWYSSYLYYAMSAWFESEDLPGFATWMKVQAAEEHGHAMRFFDFVHERGGRVTLKAIAAPPTKWSDALAAFTEVRKHEAHVTGLIDGLVELAGKEKDNASFQFLQWFVAEQVEEEKQTDDLVQILTMIGADPTAVFMLDRELGTRQPEPAAEA